MLAHFNDVNFLCPFFLPCRRIKVIGVLNAFDDIRLFSALRHQCFLGYRKETDMSNDNNIDEDNEKREMTTVVRK